jgi:hypothetical protein
MALAMVSLVQTAWAVAAVFQAKAKYAGQELLAAMLRRTQL